MNYLCCYAWKLSINNLVQAPVKKRTLSPQTVSYTINKAVLMHSYKAKLMDLPAHLVFAIEGDLFTNLPSVKQTFI